jgi:GntR family transcriptional regulator
MVHLISSHLTTEAAGDAAGQSSAEDKRSATQLLRAIRRTGWAAGRSVGEQGIDRSSPVPLYVQIRRRLLSLIAEWPDPLRRFHTDEELCRMFGVARMTVRAAIKEFVDAGLLVRTRGAGTMVAIDKVDEHVSPEMDFIDQWAHRGRPLSLSIRRYEVVGAPDAFAQALGIAADTPVLAIERLRSAGAVPVSLDFRYVDTAAAAQITEDAAGRRSLLELLQSVTPLSHADMTIEAGAADSEIADILDLMPGDPVLVRGLVYMDKCDRAVMAGVSYYRSDQSGYSIHVPLSPRDTARAEDGQWGQIVELSQTLGRTD